MEGNSTFVRNVVFILVVVYLTTRTFRITLGHILAFLLCATILYKLQQKEQEDYIDFNTSMSYQLSVIGSPSHFHYDTNLITLFYNILPWRNINANNYDRAIEAVNNILVLEEDTRNVTEFCVDNYDVALEQSRIALNLVHGFIYSIEHQLLVQKLKNVLNRLQQLLERHLDIIRQNCRQKEKNKGRPNIYSRYIQDAKTFKPYDPQRLSPFDYY